MLEGVIQGIQASKEPGATSRSISPQTFDELFLSTYPSIVGILRRMLGDCGRAEELANEAFLRLYSTALPPSAKQNVPGWLYRTAMNLGIDDLARPHAPRSSGTRSKCRCGLKSPKRRRVATSAAR